MKRIDLAKQNYFKNYTQLTMPTYGECFEAGYKTALKELLDVHGVTEKDIELDFYYEVNLSHIINFADEEIDDVPPCGTDEVSKVSFDPTFSKKDSCY